MLKSSGEVFSSAALSGLKKSLAGGAVGAVLPRNCDKGSTL